MSRILIDTDPAISIPFCDVDDGLALFLALNSPELDIEGITTTFGNSTLNQVTKVAKDILKVARRQDIPIFKGAYNEKWLGIRTSASNFLINHIKENPKEITLVALGPLTNIATIIKHRPDIIDELKRLVIMGGLVFPQYLKIPVFSQNAFVKSEFNISKDEIAAKYVFSQSLETILVGLDVTTKVLFKDIHYIALEHKKTPITNYLAKHIKPWLIFNKILFFGGFNPHDPIAVAYLLKDSLFEIKKMGLDVKCNYKKYSNINKFYRNSLTDIFSSKGVIKIISDPNYSQDKKVKVCININEKEFLKLLLKRLMD
ncbi:MAG: nucleoside hydrolase [Candidatus Helarchaeota archaeon]